MVIPTLELPGITWNYKRIIEVIKDHFPRLQKIADLPASTSLSYSIPGHKGTLGVIPAYTRSFCGTCNRVRITPKGVLKTCLYDGGVLNIKALLREGGTDASIQEKLLQALQARAKTGWEAEKEQRTIGVHESMAAIGG